MGQRGWRADAKGPLINAMKTDSASVTPSDVYVLSTARLRIWLSVHTWSVCPSCGTSASVCSECICGCLCVFAKPYMYVLPNQCVHRPLFQHHWASPLSQHKGRWETSWEERGENKSGAAAKAAGCVSFPPLLKSDRVKDRELWRYLQTVGGGGGNEGNGLTKLKERMRKDILSGISSSLSVLTPCFWRIHSPLSLYSMPKKGLVFIPSFPHQRPKLCLS